MAAEPRKRTCIAAPPYVSISTGRVAAAAVSPALNQRFGIRFPSLVAFTHQQSSYSEGVKTLVTRTSCSPGQSL